MTSVPLPMLSTPDSALPAQRAADATASRFSFLKRPLSTPITILLLAILTGIAAFLRFWRIDHQAYWTDEGYTIERIRGTWDQLLHSLDKQGFPPGWYALLQQWCLAVERLTHNSALAFSPITTRGLTALFGTLTVPAIYYLARFFTDRKGALLVTLLAAVNPFLIYYSRDIKMYAPFWFFVVLNMALFFQFLKARWYLNLPWFLLFILTGACMTALHPMAWFIPPIQLIFLLTRPRPRPFDAPLWLTGIGAMCLFPAYWYFQFLPRVSQWLDRVSSTQNDGMSWLSRYTDMSWKTVGGMLTEHLGGFLWPVNPPDARITQWFMLDSDFTTHMDTRDSPLIANWELYVAWTLLSILAVGLIPWRRMFHALRRQPSAATQAPATPPPAFRGRAWWIALWIVIPVIALAITWIPTKTELTQKIAIDQRQQETLSSDIARLRQMVDSLPKETDVWRNANNQLNEQQASLQHIDADLATSRSALQSNWSEWIWRRFSSNPNKPDYWAPKPLWEPRYLGIIVPALLLWLAASLRRLPTWPLRLIAILFVVTVSTISAFSNHLIYRNAPIQLTAQIAAQYGAAANPEALAIATPITAYAQPVNDAEFAIARGVRPGSRDERDHAGDDAFHEFSSQESVVNFLRSSASRPDIQTIIITDRYGDLTTGPLTADSVHTLLGPSWNLVHEESYQWHYEWRFYIYNTWRTRVWQRAAR